jgi:hypothetical protein
MQDKSEENKQRLNNYQSVGAVLGNGSSMNDWGKGWGMACRIMDLL